MVTNAAPATCPGDLSIPSVSELPALASTPSAGESSSTMASAAATHRATTARADVNGSDCDEDSGEEDDSDQDADAPERRPILRTRAFVGVV